MVTVPIVSVGRPSFLVTAFLESQLSSLDVAYGWSPNGWYRLVIDGPKLLKLMRSSWLIAGDKKHQQQRLEALFDLLSK